ncbi:MAG: DUF748 domain-containing protein [Geothrix sp.]|uniref:DUF748 domain-containing protein n=1 Tax=Geothrix sp. TaxID=1962974 RepID=UPI0017BABFAA|nr:DUF748 domain-containing protein [Geothrix sp.]NWJ40594.1 DUF748 domain-containing protein [Geothrix sp.]WIL21402.1 MAG: DUF748 domain-containing protein [Geothrix sp.]
MSIPAFLSTFFRRWRRLLLVLATIYGLWLLAGFFLIPALARPRIERAATEALKRPVTLAKLRFNPFTFGTTLEGLRVAEREGGDWITLRHLYVNYDVWRLLGHTVAFSTIEVDGLTFRATLDARGRLNFQDLLEGDGKPVAAAPAKEPAWILDVRRFALRGGRVEFQDRSGTAPFQTVVGPISFTLEGLRTEVGHRSGVALEAWTEAKEHLVWKGDLGFQPFASKGSLVVENISLPKYRPYEQEQVATEIRSGTAAVRSQYRLEWGKDHHVVELSDLGLTLRDVKLAERGVAEPAVELPLLEVQNGRLDLLASSMEVGAIRAEQGVVRIQKAKEGGLNLARLFAPTKPKVKKEDEKPFKLLIRDLALRGFRLGWEDLGLARPVKVEATDLNLHWQDLSLDPAASGKASLDLKLAAGSLKLEGSLAPLKASGDLSLKAEGLDLGTWDPYLDSALDLRVASGKLGVDGRLHFAFEGRKSDGLTFLGGASVLGLEVRDALLNEPFLRWKQLRLSGADLRTAPLAVAIQAVDWIDPEGRVVVQPDGSTNVARALRLAPAGKPASPAAAVLPATPASAPDLGIAKLGITGGRLSFIDRSVQPSAALVLSDLEGSYLGLSSRPDAASKVDFRGKAGGLAPITIQGHAMPLRNDLDTDVVLKILGADLTDFTPYTGKYLGYTVQKGKLNVDARLRIDHRNLKAENAVKLDQFYLGEKVQSPDATGLPVKLGLAILRDRKGVIAFDLPIEGSLDDPDVKYGKLVWKAVFGLLGKIATSPFTLIGKLFGSDAGDLSSLAFAPGSSSLEAAATPKLQALAKALQERPELRLDAEGAVDADQDGAALRKAALEALLRRTRMATLKSAEEQPVPAAERERWVKAAHEAAFPPPKEAKGVQPTPPPPVAEMEQRLLGTLKVDPADLAQLADARVKRVLAWLLDTAKADPARVFEVNTGQAKGAVVAFALK